MLKMFPAHTVSKTWVSILPVFSRSVKLRVCETYRHRECKQCKLQRQYHFSTYWLYIRRTVGDRTFLGLFKRGGFQILGRQFMGVLWNLSMGSLFFQSGPKDKWSFFSVSTLQTPLISMKWFLQGFQGHLWKHELFLINIIFSQVVQFFKPFDVPCFFPWSDQKWAGQEVKDAKRFGTGTVANYFL